MSRANHARSRAIQRRLNVLTLAAKRDDEYKNEKTRSLYNRVYAWLEENGVKFHFDREAGRYVVE